jgi:hypothetical protein
MTLSTILALAKWDKIYRIVSPNILTEVKGRENI